VQRALHRGIFEVEPDNPVVGSDLLEHACHHPLVASCRSRAVASEMILPHSRSVVWCGQHPDCLGATPATDGQPMSASTTGSRACQPICAASNLLRASSPAVECERAGGLDPTPGPTRGRVAGHGLRHGRRDSCRGAAGACTHRCDRRRCRRRKRACLFDPQAPPGKPHVSRLTRLAGLSLGCVRVLGRLHAAWLFTQRARPLPDGRRCARPAEDRPSRCGDRPAARLASCEPLARTLDVPAIRRRRSPPTGGAPRASSGVGLTRTDPPARQVRVEAMPVALRRGLTHHPLCLGSRSVWV